MWLYRMFDAAGVLLYIGQTKNPEQRIAGWYSRASNPPYHWFAAVVRIEWQQYPDRVSVLAAEKAAIETERPRYNRNHQPRPFPLRVAS